MDLIHLDKNSEYSLTFLVKRKSNNATIFTTNVPIKSAILTELDIPFTITNNIWDNIWWTWDLGSPNLIAISIKLVNLNSLESVDYFMTTGIRTVKVIQ